MRLHKIILLIIFQLFIWIEH